MTGITYVVTHRGFGSVKIGYAKVGGDRIEQLMKQGWDPFRHLHLATPQLARDVEQAALFQVRHYLSIPVHLAPGQMRTGGWTETFSARSLGAAAAWEIVCEQAGILQLEPVVTATGRQRNRPTSSYRRTKGDTPTYVQAARREAARTARAAQVGAQLRTHTGHRRAAITAKNAANPTPREDS